MRFQNYGKKYNYAPILLSVHHKTSHKSKNSHMLYSNLGAVPVKVHFIQCMNKKKECNIHYQGNADGIFNFSGNTLITYALLFDFLFSLICAKETT